MDAEMRDFIDRIRLRWMALLVLGIVPSLASTEILAADGRSAEARHKPARQEHRVPGRKVFPPPGHVINRIPERHQTIKHRRKSYYYRDGVFYQPHLRNSFIVVHAPLGVRVQHLPYGYVSFYIGPRRYYYVNFTYYLWDTRQRDYVVVKEPIGAPAAVVSSSEAGAGRLFIYPRLGQDDELRERDRFECYMWAVGQTGFDPGDEQPDFDGAGDYRRAISACLEGRGYTVK